MLDIEEMEAILNDANEEDFNAADRMYEASFRSEPFTDDEDGETFGKKVVWLCNYKGEGDSIELYEDYKHLPVFVDKNTSFYQANS